MFRALRPREVFTRWIAALTLCHIVVAIAMAASPAIHEFIHHDADDDDHDCVVTVFHAGGTDRPATQPVFAAAILPQQFFSVAEFDPQWVASLFVSQCVLEHAPPVVS